MSVSHEYVDGLSDYAEYVSGRFVTNLIEALAEAEHGSKREVYSKIGISRGTLYSGYKISFPTKKKILAYALEKLDTAEVVKSIVDDMIYTINMLVLDATKALKAQNMEDDAKKLFACTYKYLNQRVKTHFQSTIHPAHHKQSGKQKPRWADRAKLR